MARTDRADFSGPEFDTDRPWHYRTATGWGRTRKLHKAAKRRAAKADRRSDNPRSSHRGYGCGNSNYKYAYND